MLALPPFRPIQNFGQHEERLYRSEDLGGIKGCMSSALAADEDVHQIFSRASFGDDFRSELGAAPRDCRYLDLRVSALEGLFYLGLRRRAAQVDDELPLLFRRRDNILPIAAARRLRGGSVAR